MSEPYRPRRPTRAENEKLEEQRVTKKKRLAGKKKREREYRDRRSSRMNYSELNGVGYKDFTLGPSAPTRTRSQLDRRAYAEYRSRIQPIERPFLARVPSLADLCLDLVVENYAEPHQLAALDPYHHLSHVRPLFDDVRTARNDDENQLPFEFWLDFALKFGSNLPDRFKTYRGLVAEGDVQELDTLREYNQEAAHAWVREPASIPPFFLATLDLSNDRSFSDSDVYKLRNPLSSFLAVLKLDGTTITDGGITWISRAAAEGDYKHLAVISLRGLSRVTNDGVTKLSKLTNLRSLDLRNTACTAQVAAMLNNVGSSPSWAPPRARTDLRQTLIEFQLFGGSLSPSRTLSIVNYLAQLHHAPIASHDAVLHAPLDKHLSVHLSAMTRRPAPNPSKPNADKTAEELYHEQLTLSGYSGSAMATHHASFGTLTSTKSLARKLVEDDGRALGEKGAAFRTGAGDGVALGEYVGPGRTGGRASLYDLGTRKLSVPSQSRQREPFSDTEDEAEKEASLREQEAEELRIWEDKTSTGFSFYAGRKPMPKPDRVIVAAEQSRLTLLRHLPFVPPYERQAHANAAQEEQEKEVGLAVQTARSERKAEEGTTLLKKKRKAELPFATPRSYGVAVDPFSSSPGASSTPRARPPFASSSSASSSSLARTPTSTPPCAQPSSTPSNPFSKRTLKASSSGLRTDRKNIVKVTPTLTKRSSLSAFKR